MYICIHTYIFSFRPPRFGMAGELMKAAKASVAQALAAATKAGRCGLNAAGRFLF